MRRFTKLPSDAYNEIIKGAGILIKGADSFNPAQRTVASGTLLAATTGGINFSDTPEFTDFGEDIDNCPKNTKEMKEIKSREVKVSGTFVTIDNVVLKSLMAGADVDSNDTTLYVPRDVLEDDDFDDLWFVTDYSATDGGFVAIHLMNCLSTGGFTIQSTDGEKGTMSFEYTAHYTMSDNDKVPYEVYICVGAVTDTFTEVASSALTNGFQMGVTYYTRSGAGTELSPYVYTKVTSGAYDSSKTYYVKS